MEKYGVSPTIDHTELRDEEAQLMTKVASLLHNPDKEQELRTAERRLHDVRHRITRLDLGDELQEVQSPVPGEI